MDAEAALQQVFTVQHAFEVLATLMLTVYLFPKSAVITDDQEFDFIVVGAGSAGTVVAYRLAECNFKVLLVEAGGDPPVPSVIPALFPYLPHTAVDWNFTNIYTRDSHQCLRTQKVNLTIGHVLGGGSSINYMFYVRGCPGDFSYWATAANDSSWGYDGMLPYFIKSERLEDKELLSSRYRKYHGTKGFLGVTRDNDPKIQPYLEAFRELGNAVLLDVNGDHTLGYTRQLFTIAEGVRQSTAYSILARQKNVNLNVLKHTFVTNISFDKNNNAIGVKAITKDNKEIFLKARNEIIVSAGALNTPRLLMSSGIGPKDHLNYLKIPLRKNLPVGRNLHDHVPVFMYFKLKKSNKSTTPVNPHKFPLPAFTGYVALNQSQECATYQTINFLVPSGSNTLLELCVFNFGFKFDICQNIYESSKNRDTLFTALTLLYPESRGRVLLRSIDPREPPIIDVGYLDKKEDLETLVDSLMNFTQILNTTLFKHVKSDMIDLRLELCEEFEYLSRDWWRCYVRCMMLSLYHFVGTCALGSVVDNKLRVFGIGRLRVIDGSVMPRIVGGNPNAVIIALSEKGADIIKNDYSPLVNYVCNFLSQYNFWNF